MPAWRPPLERLACRTGIDAGRLILGVQEVDRVNASAGAAHLLFVTHGALALPDDRLEAVLAHELGHTGGCIRWSGRSRGGSACPAWR